MKNVQNTSSRKLIDRLVPDPQWGAMQGVMATTYELSPEFLETDFLPSVFGLGSWDDRSWATRVALEKRLFELDAAIVFSEARRYRGRPRSLRLDVRPSVSRGSVLHAKVTLLLFERAVRLIVGSANLTKQGYRENREVIAVLTASSKERKLAALIAEGLVGMENALASWLTADGRKLIQRSLEVLRPWHDDVNAGDQTSFIWSNRDTRLWREFITRWPAGEIIRRISIISPFWSEDASLTLGAFLCNLRKAAPLAPEAEVRLLTDAFPNPDGELIPILPPGYAALDWSALGVKATAQPVSPQVLPEELGGIEGFTGLRSLHAKVLLVEGERTGLAYLGSANFTGRGWGFAADQGNANTEAGLILSRSVGNKEISNLLPELVGEPILLSQTNATSLKPPEPVQPEDPWPEFICQVLLTPVLGGDSELQLQIDTLPGAASWEWHIRFLDRNGELGETLLSLDLTRGSSETTFLVPMSPTFLTRLLTDQEVIIAWSACPRGRPFPLNVDASARSALPISPGKPRIEENHLVSYYQGKIAWEQLFPDPDAHNSATDATASITPVASGVDKSRIQSYQVREFVEALAGLRQDLRLAVQSASSMRLALLGPVSPFALAQTIVDATKAGRRTPIAAAFQLVEILACLESARSHAVPDRLRGAWEEYLSQAACRIERLLSKLFNDHPDSFSANSAFTRYHRTVLDRQKKPR